MIASTDLVGTSDIDSADAAQIESRAAWMNRLASMPVVRHDRVEHIRNGLADGTYDADGRLDAALDRLIDELPLDAMGQRITQPRRI